MNVKEIFAEPLKYRLTNTSSEMPKLEFDKELRNEKKHAKTCLKAKQKRKRKKKNRK